MDTAHEPSRTQALYPAAPAVGRRPVTSKWMLLVQFVLGGVGGAAFAAFATARVEAHGWSWLALAVVLFVMVLWLQVIVHEAGHALAGLLTGRQLLGAGIGPLRLERGTGGWQMRWGGGVRGIGGFAALLPANGRGESRRAEALFLLGGPLANLLTAGLAIVALQFIAPQSLLGSVALGAAAFSGAVLGVLNLLPFESHGWRSDGRGLLDLHRDTAAGRAARMQQRVVSLSLAGVRPRDWPPELLDVPDDVSSPHVTRSAHLLRLSRALDADDRATADQSAQALAELYPTSPDGHRQGIAMMLAIYAVEAARDPALLAAWRPLCEGGLLDLTPYRLWLDAEAAAFADERATARSLAARARAALPKVHDPASALVLCERLDRLDARLDAV